MISTKEPPVDTTGPVIVALLLFTEQVKRITTMIHTKNLDDGKEIRDSEKNPLFKLPPEHKGLVKKVYLIVKESLNLCPEHAAEFVLQKNSNFFPIEEHPILSENILQRVEGFHPRPWAVNHEHDGLFDAKGNRFFNIPSPKTGFQYEHLEQLILSRQDSVIGTNCLKPALGSAF